jgi:putative flippase GtrA
LSESVGQIRAWPAQSGMSGVTLAHRIVRFGAVGVTCYLVQLSLLHALHPLLHLYPAEVLAFLFSAQVNFVLSLLLTWGDRRGAEWLPLQWAKFNANALISVIIVNATVFWLLVQVGLRFWLAMLLANAVSACCTFTVNHFFVFKRLTKPASRILGGTRIDRNSSCDLRTECCALHARLQRSSQRR